MMRRKSFVFCISILCLLFWAVSPSAYAAEIIDSGYCGAEEDGKNLTWAVTAEDELIISGEGAMGKLKENSSTDIPWSKYHQTIRTIVVGEGVTTISGYAFYHCSSATSVDLPSTLTTIEQQAFGSALRSIVVPESVSEIGSLALAGTDLSVIVFEGSFPEITDEILGGPAMAYYPGDDPTWTEAAMNRCGGSVAWMESGSAWNDITGYYGAADNESNITWTLNAEGHLSFTGSGDMYSHEYRIVSPWRKYRSIIKSVSLEDGITNIGANAFNSCYNISSVGIPASVSVIEGRAFWGCEMLTDITIPENVTEIQYDAFVGCESIKEIVIPAGVTEIADNMFAGCKGLETIAIPAGVKRIGYGAFRNCESLESIILPDGITSLSGTFEGCTKLREVNIPVSVEEIGQCTFLHCDSLTVIIVPDRVKQIDAAAISMCANLEYVVLPSSIEELPLETLSACPKLKAVTVPASVTTICGTSFGGDTSLRTIRFDGSAPQLMETEWAEVFGDVIANVYYPADDESWTTEAMQEYGGELTWVPYTTCETHSWNADSCLQLRSCVVCGYTELGAEEHLFETYVSDENATCAEDGTATARCVNCEAKDTKTDIGSRKQHCFAEREAQTPTCTEIGWDAYVICSQCDYSTYVEKSALGHDEITHEAQAPTYAEIGWHAYVTCSRCDYSTYEEIPATGNPTGENVWDGRTAEPYAGGSGAADDPFEISNGAQLYYWSLECSANDETTEDTYYEITRDIDLGDIRFTPANYFKGNLDGGGHSIRGLNIKDLNGGNTALIAQGENCVVKNLSLHGRIQGEEKTAAFVANGKNVKLENLVNFCCISGGGETGAFLGNGYGSLSSLTNYGDIESRGNYTGGIAGYLKDSSKILQCTNYGAVDGNGTAGGVVGGIYYKSSRTTYNASLTNCVNLAGVTASGRAAGIVGYLYAMGDIVNVHPTLQIYYATIDIEECVNAGDIVSNGTAAGMLGEAVIGNQYGRIFLQNSYNCGDVCGYRSYGLSYGSGTSMLLSTGTEYHYPTLSQCYNVGAVRTTSENGVSSSSASEKHTVRNVYYLANSGTDTENHKNAVANDLSDMRVAAGYLGFDFSNQWTWDNTNDYAYPILKSLGAVYKEAVTATWDRTHQTLNVSGHVRKSACVIVAIYDDSQKLLSARLYNGETLEKGISLSSGAGDYSMCTVMVTAVNDRLAPIVAVVCK